MSLKGESHCNAALRKSDPTACKLVVWIPKHKHGKSRPRLRSHHLRHVRSRRVLGGWVATATVHGGKYSLTTS